MDFSFIDAPSTRRMIKEAAEAVTKLDLWGFYSTFTPAEGKGFMWDNPHMNAIMNEIERNGGTGHSGASFAFTMYQIESIAKNGLDGYKKLYLSMVV